MLAKQMRPMFLIIVLIIVTAINFFGVTKVQAYYQKGIDRSVEFATEDYQNLTFSLDKSIYPSCSGSSTVRLTVTNPNLYAVAYTLSFSNSTPTYLIDGAAATTYIVSAQSTKTNVIAINGATGSNITITINATTPYSKTHTQVVNFDNTCPVVTLNPNTSGSYVKSASVVATVSDNQVKTGQSLKYRWQTENTCSSTASDYTSVSLPSTNSVTITASGLNGTYYLCIYGGIQDVAGNNSAAVKSWEFYFDNIAPTINLPAEPFYVRKGTTPLVNYASASDSGGSGLSTFTANYTDTSSLSLGEHSLTYTATDNAGNTTTETIQMIVYTKIDCDMDDITTDPTNADRCIFRGANPDNWILFDAQYNGNDPVAGTGVLYRIIGKEANDTAKIIVSTDQRTIGITTKDWAFHSSESSVYNGSTLRTYLNTTYYNVLKDTTKNMIQPTRFDVGTMNYYNTSSNTIANTVTAEKSAQEPNASYVATWNVYDFLLASTNCGANTPWTTITTKTNGHFPCDVDNWMVYDTTSSFEIWFITPHSSGRTRRYMSPANTSNAGSIQYTSPTTTRRIRPVTYLKSTVIIIGGTGTESDPYILAPDKFVGTPYTVTFDPNGGTVSPTSKTVMSGMSYGDLPTPTKTGYNFLGWSTEQHQNLTFIQSTGTQYIDTNYYASSNLGIVADLQFTSVTPTQQRLFGGTNSSGQDLSYAMYINGSGNWAYAFQNGTGNFKSTGVAALTNRYTFQFNRSGLVVISGLYSDGIEGNASITSAYKFTIFAANSLGNINNYAKMKLYSFKMYANNTNSLVRDYVPSYRNIDGAIGLYDKVNDVFYPNAGTGKFTKGSFVNSFVTSTTEVTTNSNHTLYAVWEKSIPTCTVTTDPGYDTSKVLTINATSAIPLDTNPYSWDNSTWTSDNQRTISTNAVYTAYVKDSDGEIGTCSLQIKPRSEWRSATCTGTVSYGQWTSSGSGYITNGSCQYWTYETSKRECPGTYTLWCPTDDVLRGGFSGYSICMAYPSVGCLGSLEMNDYVCYPEYTNYTRSCSCSAWSDWSDWSPTEPNASCSLKKSQPRTTYGT